MWLSNLFPELFLHLLAIIPLFGGLGLYLLSLLVRLIPSFGYLRSPLRITGVVLMVLGIYSYGVYDTEMHWKQKLANVQKELDAKKQESEKTNVVIQKVYITKTQKIKDTQVVIEEKIREVEKIIDRDCRVPKEAISILNQAAVYPIETKK